MILDGLGKHSRLDDGNIILISLATDVKLFKKLSLGILGEFQLHSRSVNLVLISLYVSDISGSADL